ncbi:N,N-dimethylformamidase beta subunit family domain-containing protein [Roseomonas sp. 18066]|uniref:N,N-dimethylformamidase beta subunit family domain-containing protein n=1 Tax=Roseomonas sp. 18066 TaxID=2681412 RepID=UPI00135CDAA2|nr:N,N-dimethylformamidase beta subunit family domain-containing protein [Roseomonas sp. 18066]
MLPVTGYVDRWSVRPGETIRFMISSRGAQPYRARLARIFCGDPNPKGPGYRERAMPCGIEGAHAGAEQPVRPGSRGFVPRLDLATSFSVALTLKPTLLDEAAPQTLLQWQGLSASLHLWIEGRQLRAELASPAGVTRAVLGRALAEGWQDLALARDAAAGVLTLASRPRPDSYGPAPRIAAVETSCPAASLGQGQLMLAASLQRDLSFSGRLERPTVYDGAWPVAALLDAQAGGAAPIAPAALWDFSEGIGTDRITDRGPNGFHGTLENLPTRAVTGAAWSGRHHRWTEAPAEYAAIHFHADDVGDLGWAPSLALTVPADWPSGLYALHLETAEGRDNIPFVIRAAEAGSQARVALLLPTLTYQIYGQYPRREVTETSLPRAEAWGALVEPAHRHPEYGLSAYNTHADGSGVTITSMRRPMPDKRVNQIHRLDESPEGSGTYWLAADTYLIDWLDRRGIACELITDHDLHAEGVGLLNRYSAVLTGQHPEYHTEETRGAIAEFIAGGGRFLYLGGNGFYWKIVPFQGETWAVELRRAEGGIRTWAAEPGEGYHAFDGSYGGLWRRLGKPPQALVGVGFTAQGEYRAEPYRFTDAIDDPRLAFMRAGLEEAVPGTAFGERGLMGGGAAGHEIDRTDKALGTPRHALVLAVGLPQHASFEPANEDRLTQEWPGAREEIIRSDITFFESAGGGAVFSVGSMSFIGALPIDNYENLLARLMENVVRRFADPTPFPWPLPESPL